MPNMIMQKQHQVKTGVPLSSSKKEGVAHRLCCQRCLQESKLPQDQTGPSWRKRELQQNLQPPLYGLHHRHKGNTGLSVNWNT